ncbi:MAG: SGNH/GDSL hydrolase family protein [Ardenticatenaceae bacterium]|nr:SGNH/GDSL hydrolase family protein [Ardenticatenaceae bacterium]
MQQIFAEGQALGRNPHNFSKLGDSVIANGDFLTRFDVRGSYTLGPYESLQPVIDHFRGSWERYGVGMHIGLRAWGVFDPLWANKDWCEANEHMLDCEIRLNNPSVLLIHLGSNDLDPSFDKFMRDVVQHTLDNKIIPIILTKADRYEGEDNRNNIALRQIAADFEVPLLDFDVVAATLPNRGIKEGDNVHLSGSNQLDYSLPEVYEKGHSVHNLTVLFMLERILYEVIEPGSSNP